MTMRAVYEKWICKGRWKCRISSIERGISIMNKGMYRNDEIKYKIDTCVQQSMYENNKELWKVILELQTKLYDEFGIDE